MKNLEQAVNPAGVGPVKTTADNIINRWKDEVTAAQQKTIENNKANAESAAGRIVQGTAADAKTAQKVLQSLDTTGVKTYDDLNAVQNAKLESLAKTQDKLLSKYKTTRTIDEFGKVQEGGALRIGLSKRDS
jgi:hypothetical protein